MQVANIMIERLSRGGHGCCQRNSNRLCGLGEGDCEHDYDCEGQLVCGKNNCATTSGGLWDPTDDCCEKRLNVFSKTFI
jgi:hypothetical protein